MKNLVLVVSDLHLGGDEVYRICGTEGQGLLVGFLRWVVAQAQSVAVHLVLNGDSVDFLTEPEFRAFTTSDDLATEKLKKIFGNSEEIWNGFRAVLEAGARLSILLGNHDLELSLPGPRRELLERLGPGKVEFIYDNQALAIGELLIEHGNQYDRWNKVDHDGLRRIRAVISRGQDPDSNFKAPPGSRLVVDIMNDLKRDFNFINLLKPENQAAVPILGVLRPGVLRKIRRLVPVVAELLMVDTAAIAARTDDGSSGLDAQDAAAFALADELAFGEGDCAAAAGNVFSTFKEAWRLIVTREARDLQLQTIRRALYHWAGPNLASFDTRREAPEYLNAARRSAQDGFKVVTYGHTHLAKRIELVGDTATYLNSGTWADLMRVPSELLLTQSAVSQGILEQFVDDLMENRMGRWTSQLATFVRVEMEDTRVIAADVWRYRAGEVERLPEGQLPELIVSAPQGSSLGH